MSKQTKTWKINHGGLYRCCIRELESYMKESHIVEGDILTCEQCQTEISARNGVLSKSNKYK